MGQTRIGEYGHILTDASIREMNRARSAAEPRVVVGLVPYNVAANTLGITVGYGITEEGVLVGLDAAVEVPFTTTADPKWYTVLMYHTAATRIGGEAATFGLSEGLSLAVAGAVVLGWIVYPGGNVPLAFEQIIPVPPLQVTTLNADKLDVSYPHKVFYPPLNEFVASPGTSANLQKTTTAEDIGNGFASPVVQVQNIEPVAARIWQVSVQLEEHSVGGVDHPWAYVAVNYKATTASLSVYLTGSDGVPELVGAAAATGAWNKLVFDSVPRKEGAVLLTLQAEVPAAESVYFGNVEVSANPIPA